MHYKRLLVPSIYLVMLALLWTSCEETVYTPRPRGYPKIEYPERTYQQFQEGYCEFTFEYPTYAVVEQDTIFFDEAPAHPCWFNIVLPAFDGQIHFTYYPIKRAADLDKLKMDAFKLADEHTIKADYIDEQPIAKGDDVSGFIFDIEGAAASPYQFYLTDSQQHFLRGALYFNTQSRPDSLAPVFAFVKEDIQHLIETFKWKEKNPK